MKRLTVILLLLFALEARGDLKSWLHGAPPAPSPGPPDAKAATVSFAPNVTPDKQVLDFMNAFAEAMRVHDGKSLKPFLSEIIRSKACRRNTARPTFSCRPS